MAINDAFARKTAVRALQATIEAERKLDDLLDRMALIEKRTSHMRYLRRCFYFGSPSLGPTCREHADLLVADDFSPTWRGAA